MPRKRAVAKRELPGDPVFGNPLVTRFLNSILAEGKRSKAESIFYKAMKLVETKSGQEPMAVLKQAMNNVKPVLEVKSRRGGGANYQGPVEGRPRPRHPPAIRPLLSLSR